MKQMALTAYLSADELRSNGGGSTMPKKNNIRKEKLSIYLVKDPLAHEAQILKIENAKSPITLDIRGSDSAVLYIKKDQPKPPPRWTQLFSSAPEVPDDAFGSSATVGAAFKVKTFDHVFIITFGSGFHLIQSDAIERDFGLRVTLNSVDPDKLRSLDKASYDHNPLNSRTQSTKDVDIFELHVDSELEMLYAVTGASTVELFGPQVTGRDALTIMTETSLDDICNILMEAYARYKSKLPSKFEWVDNISRVRNTEEIQIIELELDQLLTDGKTSNLWLGEPEVVDWETQLGYSFDLYPRSPRTVTLELTHLFEHLKSKNLEISVETIKSTTVHVNNNEYQSTKSWSAFRCLYAEIIIGKEQYILRNSTWYRVDTNFLNTVDDYLSDLTTYNHQLPVYSQDREEDYNSSVVNLDSTFELMDKKNIGIGGPYDKLEFCDLVKDGRDLVHVKYYRSSSTLSHLFSQGCVSAETFIKDVEFREKLNSKLPSSIKLSNTKLRPSPSDYRIVYAIATTKKIPEELPFFSKVTLKNALKTLRALNFVVEISCIKVDPQLHIKKKCKPSNNRPQHK